jgi:effector-binding domain-containing protein
LRIVKNINKNYNFTTENNQFIMRILKYIFLLLLLTFVALSIFIATQKGDFFVERSKIINASKSSVFNHLNDYRNWTDFGSWSTEDPEMKINYSQNTIGKGASYSWEGKEGAGEIQTLYVKENDSISQKMNYNGTTSTVSWSFKDTIGGTKVTCRTKGKMSFMFKIYTALNGGVDRVIGTIYEKSLANLDKILDYEINTYSIKINGLIKKPQTFYIGQTFTSEIEKVNTNFKIVVPKIITFCKENNVPIKGNPFVIYHTYDVPNGLTKISICIPILSEIFISAGSDLTSGKLEAFEAVKTTLTGDYSHALEGYNKTVEYINKNQLIRDTTISHIEIYPTDKTEVKNPSKWVTELYIPLMTQTVPLKPSLQPNLKSSENYTEPTVTVPTVLPTKKIKVTVVKSEIKKTPLSQAKEEQSEF